MNTIPDIQPSFTGKTVTFYSGGWESLQILASISSPRFEMQAGRMFLVGEAATSSDSWAHGSHAGVAWDEVSSYLVLDSDDFQDRQDLRKKNRATNKKSTTRGFFSFLRRY